MRVLVTGSRNWADGPLLTSVLGSYGPWDQLVVGDAPGADALARKWADASGVQAHVFTADWERFGKGAGAMRNQRMVERGADLCIAFPLPGSKGTWDCMRRAVDADISVYVVNPNGWD